MKTRLKAKQEDTAMDACLLKREMDTSSTAPHLKPEPHVRHHAIAIDTVKGELEPGVIQVKTEPSCQDVKMADDSDSDMSDGIVKQETIEMSPSLALDTKSHQDEIGSASLRIVAKQESATASPKPRLKTSKELGMCIQNYALPAN